MEKKTLKKVLSIVGNVFLWLFVVFSIIVTVYTIAVKSSGGIPSIGGKAVLIVESESMEHTINKGDVIIGQKLSPEEQLSLKKGDIITFPIEKDGKEALDTHRIVKVIKEDGKVSSYITQGDNKEMWARSGFTTESVLPENVICKYTGTRIPFVGAVLSFLQSSIAFLLCVVLPLVALFIYEGFRFVKKYLEIKGAGKVSAEDEERIRKEAVEEYLRSKENAGEAEAPAEDTSAAEAEAPAEDTSEDSDE